MTAEGAPEGTAYEWYQRAISLLDRGDASASLVLLDRVLLEDPGSASAREARARALFDARRLDDAAAAFDDLVQSSPADDYAHYGLGICLWRLQRFRQAEDHLAMALVMRPDRDDYRQALDQVRATLRARRQAGLPLEGPLDSGTA